MTSAIDDVSTEVTRLARRVETARGKLPLQQDRALLEVLSEAEIAAERELAEWVRAQRRKQRRWQVENELATEKRDRRNAAAIRRAEEADTRWHRRALAARRRASDHDARLAQLYRRAEWSSRALIGVVILGMVWAGVNVQHNLVPSGDMTDPLYWLSYGIEAMISIPIITIMVVATTAARWGRSLPRGKIALAEIALLGVTVGLNAGPHLTTNPARAIEFAIAPIMVGVVIWLHAWVAARYAFLIDNITEPHAERTEKLTAPPAMTTIAASPTDSPTPETAESTGTVVAAGTSDEPGADEPQGAVEPAEQPALGGVVSFTRHRENAERKSAADSRQPRGRRWFGGDLTADEVRDLAEQVHASRKTQQSVDALTYIIGAANEGHTPTAIARELNMTAHTTVLRALNIADDLCSEHVA
uniref:hypothetical protein n=1 Tax=Nocardia suismassiliense TaxID=2077092 RepID=UPI003F491980